MMKDRRGFVSRACDPFRKRVTTEKKEESMAVDAPFCIALPAPALHPQSG